MSKGERPTWMPEEDDLVERPRPVVILIEKTFFGKADDVGKAIEALSVKLKALWSMAESDNLNITATPGDIEEILEIIKAEEGYVQTHNPLYDFLHEEPVVEEDVKEAEEPGALPVVTIPDDEFRTGQFRNPLHKSVFEMEWERQEEEFKPRPFDYDEVEDEG